MSRKAAEVAPIRRDFVARILLERPVCERPGCTNRSYDVHERISRARGGSILDPSNVLAICRPCHSWVHDHPAEATELGLLTPSFAAVCAVSTCSGPTARLVKDVSGAKVGLCSWHLRLLEVLGYEVTT